MKSITLLLCVCCYSQLSLAQDKCEKDSAMYMQAYCYIINDSVNVGKIIDVADSIIDLDRFWFSSQLDPVEREIVNQYRKKKNYIWVDSYYSSCLSSWFPHKNTLAKYTLFFSEIDDNMLRANILPYDEKRMGKCNKFKYELYRFLMGYIYLFVFNDDDFSLKKVVRSEMIFD